jgi:hypothetical protein
MSFSKISQHLMVDFFDIFDTFMYNKSSSQGKVDQLLYYLYKEIIVSKKVYNKVYKKLIKKSIKEINTLNDLPRTDLLNGKYISKTIKNTVLNEGLCALKFDLNIQGLKIQLNFIVYDEEMMDKLYIIDNYADKIFIYIKFLLFFLKNKKPRSINYYIYLTKHKKLLPKNKTSIIGPVNCNTGLTYGCQENGEIAVYRQEEWFKVCCHETIHSFCLDFNNLNSEKVNNIVKGIVNIKSFYNLFESYTEFWALIFNTLFSTLDIVGTNLKSKKEALLYIDFMLQYEKLFSLYQCVKVLNFMGLSYKNLIGDDDISNSLKNLYYKENSNVFAYYILKLVLLYYKDNFLLWCKENNKNVFFIFTKNDESLISFGNFLKDFLSKEDIKKDIEKMEQFFKSKKNDKTLLHTLRMTIINTQ